MHKVNEQNEQKPGSAAEEEQALTIGGPRALTEGMVSGIKISCPVFTFQR